MHHTPSLCLFLIRISQYHDKSLSNVKKTRLKYIISHRGYNTLHLLKWRGIKMIYMPGNLTLNIQFIKTGLLIKMRTYRYWFSVTFWGGVLLPLSLLLQVASLGSLG